MDELVVSELRLIDDVMNKHIRCKKEKHSMQKKREISNPFSKILNFRASSIQRFLAETLSTKIFPELLYGFDIDLRVNRGYNESPGSLDKQKKVKKLTNWRTYRESQLLLSQKQAVYPWTQSFQQIHWRMPVGKR